MTATTLLAAVLVAVGLVGILVPILPGSVLVVAGVLVWAWAEGGATAWTVFAASTLLVAAGAVVKYVVPGRRLQVAGIPASTQWVGVLLGVVGFFVVPVIGLFLGFVLGVYLAELARVGTREAWPSTVHSLKAVGLSIVIELLAALGATVVWLGGVIAT
ncbi:DUF456 family protein [Nocardioides sp. LMS-CY]|uniref:DUF456 domain-containing protein n=1 Tax=Nocardioides soli TaxID=1036020 RepID=A0A7W4YYK9_9ACTN|nr:DUF456 domain-containing protein [Nocardioides sp. LMS-CY]MBB3040204.1 hypothetical protein [Nocardioides soli]QWF24296.1 DUF456 family protein [Nocardioides sp. LMS-CY]